MRGREQENWLQIWGEEVSGNDGREVREVIGNKRTRNEEK